MDSPTQKLDVELVLQLVRKIGDTLGQGELHQQRVKLGIQLGEKGIPRYLTRAEFPQ